MFKTKYILVLTAAALIINCNSIYQKGDSFVAQGNHEDAVKEYTKIIEKDSYNLNAYLRLAESYAELNNFKESYRALNFAEQVDEKSIKVKSIMLKVQYIQAEHYKNSGEFSGAVRIYEQIIENNPTETKAYANVAELYKKVGKISKSMEAYSKIKDDPESTETVRKELSELNAKFSESEKLFSEGFSLYKKDMFYESIDFFKKAVDIRPDYEDAKYMMYVAEGRHSVKKGSVVRMWKAIEVLSNASLLRPEAHEPVYYLAMAYEKKDKMDFDSPITYYKKVVTLAPKSELAAKSTKKIKELTDLKAKYDKFFKKKGWSDK